MECITHHNACDCREEKFRELEQKVDHWKHIAEINRLECETMHSEKEGLEKSIRHLQYTAIHRNDDNSVIVTSDLMNIKIK